MKTLTKQVLFDASPIRVFDMLDNVMVTGSHMTKASPMLMGSRLQLAYLTPNHTGPGTRYRWRGNILGFPVSCTVRVTGWVPGVEKTWESNHAARMVILSWFRMHLLLEKQGKKTQATLSISYERPDTWPATLFSFLFANIYCRWCLRRMLHDANKQLQARKTRAGVTEVAGNMKAVVKGGATVIKLPR